MSSESQDASNATSPVSNWTNASNALTDGSGYAYATNTVGLYFEIYNFGFGIPTDATIEGIEVLSDAWVTLGCTRQRLGVSLSWNGGTNYTSEKTVSLIGMSEATYTSGSPTDTWGRSWTPAEINSSNFRVKTRISQALGCVFGNEFRDDYVRVTVYYSQGGVYYYQTWTP